MSGVRQSVIELMMTLLDQRVTRLQEEPSLARYGVTLALADAHETVFSVMGSVGLVELWKGHSIQFTYRGNVIRIYGAGYWRKGRKIYENQNKIHR